MTLKCVAIDDELSALENISIIINEKIENAEIVGTASNIIEGIKLIRKLKPDLVFLDISMPNGTGFDLLDIYGEINFEFVFVTAYEEYSIQAIKKSASDYILKPIDVEELKETIERVLQKINSFDSDIVGNRLTVNSKAGIEFVHIKDIIRVEAQKSYAKLFVENREPIFVTKALSELEKKLPTNIFHKCHRSHLINISKVKKYLHQDGGIIILTDNIEIPISNSKKNEILSLLKNSNP